MNFPSWRTGAGHLSTTLARAAHHRTELSHPDRGPTADSAGPDGPPEHPMLVAARQRAHHCESFLATGDADLGLGTDPLLAPPRAYTVLVADDAAATRRGLMELLEDIPDLECVAAVGDANAAVVEAARFRPDIALLDVMMPGGGGLSAALGIRDVSPQTRMLAYSVSSDRASVIQMLRSGARGYLVKGAPAQDLIDGLRRCADGRTALSEGLSEHLVAEMGELGRAEHEGSAAARARYERYLNLLRPGGSTPSYQPVVNLRTGAVAGYEALTRFGDQMGSSTEEISAKRTTSASGWSWNCTPPAWRSTVSARRCCARMTPTWL